MSDKINLPVNMNNKDQFENNSSSNAILMQPKKGNIEQILNQKVNADNIDEIIVDFESNNLNTIQKAVDLAVPYTKIKLLPGIYREPIIIEKPFIEIESASLKDPAYIISIEKPCVTIKGISNKDSVKLTNLYFIYQGLDKEEYDYNDDSLMKKYVYSNSEEIESLEINYIINNSIIEGVIKDNKGEHSAVSVFSGNLIMTNCQITLSFLTSWSFNEIIPGIYIENSNFISQGNTLTGNKEYLSIGILLNNSSSVITNNKIINFRACGIMGNLEEENKVLISRCNLTKNLGAGIFIKGNGDISVEDNSLEKNMGLGIKLLNCKKIYVTGNRMNDNLTDGGYFINCDGIVMLNSFIKNKGNGIIIETIEDKTSEIKVLKNTIEENSFNGVLIRGKGNKSLVFSNEIINYNGFAGIHIDKKASPMINNNKIGILIVTDSSAIIEENEIYSNVKGNIAFGGSGSENTVIKANRISGARSEGIYVIKAKGGKILHNEIFNNNDGLVIANSELTVLENNIYNNIRTGVIICEGSKPNFVQNNIHNNQFLGMMVRENSRGRYIGNIFKFNISQFFLSENCTDILEDLNSHNTIEGRIDVKNKCSIF